MSDLDEEELKATRKMNGADREIKVGDYIRTKQGYLGKYQKSANGFDEFRDSEGIFSLDITDIVKHSKNIIDLIENTDILQVEISEEWVVKEDTIRFIIVGQTYTIEEIKEALENGIYKIKKILTKEQYNANCFRLEE